MSETIVNCCQCSDGNYLNLKQYAQCFNCGHHLGSCCPLAGESKPSRVPKSALESDTNSSSANASTSSTSWAPCSHGSYYTGYH